MCVCVCVVLISWRTFKEVWMWGQAWGKSTHLLWQSCRHQSICLKRNKGHMVHGIRALWILAPVCQLLESGNDFLMNYPCLSVEMGLWRVPLRTESIVWMCVLSQVWCYIHFGPRTREAEAGESWVQGQSGLWSKTLFQQTSKLAKIEDDGPLCKHSVVSNRSCCAWL